MGYFIYRWGNYIEVITSLILTLDPNFQRDESKYEIPCHFWNPQDLVFTTCGSLVSGTPDGGFRDHQGLLRLVQA